MILDLVILTIIILIFIRGYRQGFIVAVFSLLAVLVGMACALKLSHSLADFFNAKDIITSSWGLFISYLILFLGALYLVRTIANIIEKAFRAMLLGWLNSLAGGVLYTLAGLLICSSLLWLAERGDLISPELFDNSYACIYLLPVAPWAFDGIAAILPAAREIFADAGDFFADINQKLSDYVGID